MKQMANVLVDKVRSVSRCFFPSWGLVLLGRPRGQDGQADALRPPPGVLN